MEVVTMKEIALETNLLVEMRGTRVQIGADHCT